MGDVLDKGGGGADSLKRGQARPASPEDPPEFVASESLKQPRQVNLYLHTNVTARYGQRGGDLQAKGAELLSDLLRDYPRKYDGSAAGLSDFISFLENLCSPTYQHVEFRDMLKRSCRPETFEKIMTSVFPQNRNKEPEMPPDYTLADFEKKLEAVFGVKLEALRREYGQLRLEACREGISGWCAEVVRLNQALGKQEDVHLYRDVVDRLTKDQPDLGFALLSVYKRLQEAEYDGGDGYASLKDLTIEIERAVEAWLQAAQSMARPSRSSDDRSRQSSSNRSVRFQDHHEPPASSPSQSPNARVSRTAVMHEPVYQRGHGYDSDDGDIYLPPPPPPRQASAMYGRAGGPMPGPACQQPVSSPSAAGWDGTASDPGPTPPGGPGQAQAAAEAAVV